MVCLLNTLFPTKPLLGTEHCAKCCQRDRDGPDPGFCLLTIPFHVTDSWIKPQDEVPWKVSRKSWFILTGDLRERLAFALTWGALGQRRLCKGVWPETVTCLSATVTLFSLYPSQNRFLLKYTERSSVSRSGCSDLALRALGGGWRGRGVVAVLSQILPRKGDARTV